MIKIVSKKSGENWVKAKGGWIIFILFLFFLLLIVNIHLKFLLKKCVFWKKFTVHI